MFLATALEHGPARREQEEQDIRQQWVTRSAFEQLIHDSAITDIATIAAYALLCLRQGELTGHHRPTIETMGGT